MIPGPVYACRYIYVCVCQCDVTWTGKSPKQMEFFMTTTIPDLFHKYFTQAVSQNNIT